jgi:hypothetical protein
MYSDKSVIWLDSPTTIDEKIEMVINNGHQKHIEDAKKWFETINQHPVDKASERIWESIDNIISKKNE